MARGFLSIVLHAHLPFVRHPERTDVLEEMWLHEAVTGTYLPLLQVFEGLVADGVPYRCTVSLSAPLISMMTDDLLKTRYAAHIDKLIELADKELDRTRPEPQYHRLAQMYVDRFRSLRHTWRCHDGNLVAAFRKLQEAGRVEVITSTATHAFFPLMDRNWAAIRAQVHTAADLYERHFGGRPPGMWLGECGYVPGVDELLREAGIRYFFVDTHALRLRGAGAGLRVVRPGLLPHGRRRLRPRRRVVGPGVEREGGLPRRPALPRLLPRHRLRPADGLHRPLHPPRGAPHLHRDQVPRDHPRRSCTTSGSTTPRSRAARAGEHAAHFRAEPPAAGGAPRRPHGPSADRGQPLRRGALRALVVRGPPVPGRPLPPAPLRPGRRGDDHAGRLPASATPPTRSRRPPPRPGGRAGTTSTGSTSRTRGSTGTCTPRPSGWSSSRAASRTPRA